MIEAHQTTIAHYLQFLLQIPSLETFLVHEKTQNFSWRDFPYSQSVAAFQEEYVLFEGKEVEVVLKKGKLRLWAREAEEEENRVPNKQACLFLEP